MSIIRIHVFQNELIEIQSLFILYLNKRGKLFRLSFNIPMYILKLYDIFNEQLIGDKF